MNRRSIQALSCILLLLLIGYACTDSATDADSGPAIIEGRVESVSSDESSGPAQMQNVEGALVTAAEVVDDGSLETIGGAEVETDAQGEFALEISGEDMESVQDASRIVIVARGDEGTGKSFVTSNVQSGSTVQAKPITVESTIEAEVLEEIVSNGEEGMIPNAVIEATVDSVVAAYMEGDSGAFSNLAVILGDQAELKTTFYDREGIETDGDRQEEIDQLLNDAQVEYENRLYDLAGAEDQQEVAFDNFIETFARAEPEAGVEASGAAKASYLASLLLISGDPDFSEEAASEIYLNNSFKTASLLNVAVQNQLEALGAENGTISITEDAGDNLQNEIRAASEVPVEDIRSLFSDYRSEVVTAIESDAAVAGTTFSTVNDIVGGEGGAKAAFDSAVEGISDPGIIVEAYVDFNTDVRSTVNSGFDDEESENFEAYTELLQLLNLIS